MKFVVGEGIQYTVYSFHASCSDMYSAKFSSVTEWFILKTHNTPNFSGVNGVLGTGNTSDVLEPPISSVDLGDDFIPRQLDCGGHHCCAVSTVNSSKCWGAGYWGQLGQGNEEDLGDEPGEMGNNLRVIDWGSNFAVDMIAAGSMATCVISMGADLKCIGFVILVIDHILSNQANDNISESSQISLKITWFFGDFQDFRALKTCISSD